MTIDGRRRKVVMNVGKMAILDALDAATGEYLFSIDAGTQNVITHIDPKTGAKTIDPEKWPDPKRPAVICPAVSGARSWPPTSYSPQTGAALSAADRVVPPLRPGRIQAADLWRRAQPRRASGQLRTARWAGCRRWTSPGGSWRGCTISRAPLSTSLLATAGGVVFSGDLDPALKAFDDATGKLLWQAAARRLAELEHHDLQHRQDAVRRGGRWPAQQSHQRPVEDLQRVPEEPGRAAFETLRRRRRDLGLRVVTSGGVRQ